jgi:hypothetical protein
MSLAFSCPSCGASGSTSPTHAGKVVRCKGCQYRFPLPQPDQPLDDGYGLEPPTARVEGSEPASESVYAAARRDRDDGDRPPRPTGKRRRSRKQREEFEITPTHWLIAAGAVVGLLAAVACFMPEGTAWVGRILMLVGSIMILVGYSVGLIGAFREDSLYGFLYFFIPFYSAYYLLTRWDDLWRWFACSTAGVLLVVLGGELLWWGGVAVE